MTPHVRHRVHEPIAAAALASATSAGPLPVSGFPPVSAADACVLILGSMPGQASLHAVEYYAHPQNRFWPFMGLLVGALPSLEYTVRLQRLVTSRIALWDVLASCERKGSLDSAIRDDSAQANDFAAFFAAHPQIHTVLFNGAKAESSFRRQVLPTLGSQGLVLHRLPSTSPANASQTTADKLSAWRMGLQAAGAMLIDAG